MTDFPDPLLPIDIDVRDLDGFMLNVERLMSSELMALSSHEVIAAALFLWCRAWKQMPAASLPDDDQVIAAFARLPLKKFLALKPKIIRGFVKCSDGRLYHKVLADEALAAYGRKKAFRDRREKDAERLRNWRTKQPGNSGETPPETINETRFVREGQGRDRDGTGTLNKEDAPPLRAGTFDDVDPASTAAVVSTPEADLFRRGKEILGSSAGGMIKRLLKSRGDNIALTRAALETASTKEDPREYVGALINLADAGHSSRDLGGSRSSRDM